MINQANVLDMATTSQKAALKGLDDKAYRAIMSQVIDDSSDLDSVITALKEALGV